MLARNYLTADELRCSEVERDAAVAVLNMLQTGKIKLGDMSSQPFESGFNMGTYGVGDPKEGPFCGCIAGWCEVYKGGDLSQRMNDAWRDLFEPQIRGHELQDAEFFSIERCARALHAKLTTGKADWR